MKYIDTYQTSVWSAMKLHRLPYEVQWNLSNTVWN